MYRELMASCSARSSSARPGQLDLAVLDLDGPVLLGQLGRLLLQLGVGVLQLLLLHLEQLLRRLERLGLVLQLQVRAASARPAGTVSSSDWLCSSWVRRCDSSSSSSVRVLAMIVATTTPTVSTICSRKAWLIEGEGAHGGQLDDAQHLLLEHHRQHDHVHRGLSPRPEAMRM